MRINKILLCIILFLPIPCGAADNDTWPLENQAEQQPQFGLGFTLRGDILSRSGDPFSAINEYRKAIDAGYNGSDVYRNLATVQYMAGFQTEAVETLQEAIRLYPKEVLPRQELATLYFALGKEKEAKKLFLGVLADNPTQANAYHYLGIIAFREGKVDYSWLHARRAQLLGNKSNSLMDKLMAWGNEPLVNQRTPVGDEVCFRQILLPSFEEAEEVMKRLDDGEMFEVVATTASIGPAADNGGYVGCRFPDEMNTQLSEYLWQQEAYAEPAIIQTDRGAHIVQRVQPFDLELWRIQIAALTKPKPVVAASMVEKEEVEGWQYFVHAGTYNGPVLAASIVSRLRDDKLPAYYTTEKGKNGEFIYKVIAGHYPGKADAEALANRVDSMGISNEIAYALYTPEVKRIATPLTTPEVTVAPKPVTVAKVEPPKPPAPKVPKKAVPEKTAKKETRPPKNQGPKLHKKTARTIAALGKAVRLHVKSDKRTIPSELVIMSKKDEPSGVYTVHVGTLKNLKKTKEQITRLRKLGLPAFAYPSKTTAGKKIYRLVGGRFDEVTSANLAHRCLTSQGIKSFIANTQ